MERHTDANVLSYIITMRSVSRLIKKLVGIIISTGHNTDSTVLKQQYIANLSVFPDLDSTEDFSHNVPSPTNLVFTYSKILYYVNK